MNKFIFVLVATLLLGASAFAATKCEIAVMKDAMRMKTQAKVLLRATEDEIDRQIDESGEVGFGMRDRSQDKRAKAILEAVRNLEQADWADESVANTDRATIENLCVFKLNVEEAVK